VGLGSEPCDQVTGIGLGYMAMVNDGDGVVSVRANPPVYVYRCRVIETVSDIVEEVYESDDVSHTAVGVSGMASDISDVEDLVNDYVSASRIVDCTHAGLHVDVLWNPISHDDHIGLWMRLCGNRALQPRLFPLTLTCCTARPDIYHLPRARWIVLLEML
jgi:hypothetical protein